MMSKEQLSLQILLLLTRSSEDWELGGEQRGLGRPAEALATVLSKGSSKKFLV